MPRQRIPIANLQESANERLGGSSPIAMNVWMDNKGTVYRRPGIGASSLYDGQIDSEGVDAVHTTPQGVSYAVGGRIAGIGVGVRNIYRVTDGGAVNLAPTNDKRLVGTLRPVVAETEAMLVLAAGNRVQKVTLATNVPEALEGDPPDASHVIMNSSRLLANDVVVDRTAVRFSDPAMGTSTTGHETWGYGGYGTSGYFIAEAQPDPVQAIAENSNEVLVWGTNTVQVYVPDASLIFAPLVTSPHGIIAPYSVVNAEGNFAWLNQSRQFVVSNGREFQPISGPIQGDLDAMGTVSGGFGYRVVLDGKECLAWTFPTDGRTFVFQKEVGWGQWAGWSAASANWTRLPVNCHHLRRDTGENLVGTTTGYVGRYDTSATTDLGSTVRAYVETGYLNRGTEAEKWCKDVTMVVRRGRTTSSTAPQVRLSFSDEPGYWSPPMVVGLGLGGDTTSVIPLGAMGTYRRRAWRFEFSDSEYLGLVALEEDFEAA